MKRHLRSEAHLNLSIAAVCYHAPQEELHRLLGSVLEAIACVRQDHGSGTIAFYLIDNAEQASLSLDDFAPFNDRLDSLNVELRLIQGHGNVGYGRGHNLILSRLKSDFHLMLNTDVVLERRSLLAGIGYFSENADAVMLSPSARDSRGDKQYLCKRYPSVLTFLIRGFVPRPLQDLFRKRLDRFEMRELPDTEPSPGIPIVSGCCMFCRTGVLQAVGGFDERYFLYFEDFDLSLRLRERGRIDYLPAMAIEHGGGHAASKGLKHVLMFFKSGARFFNSHGWRIVSQ